MCRPLFWSLIIAAVGLVLSSLASAAEPGPPAVEEWQVKGILTALKDGYAGVRGLAAKELVELLNSDTSEGSLREWRKNSHHAAKDAVPTLRELLKDKDSDVRWTAAVALVRLYEGAKGVAALRVLLKDENPYVLQEAALALGQ
jgi:HEAT repeat protein